MMADTDPVFIAPDTDETSAEEEVTTDAADAAESKSDVPLKVKQALSKANNEALTLRLRLKEYEDRDKTEAQRLQERAEAAEARAAELESESVRRDVADDKGLTPAQAKRLVGTTREELEADADQILEDFPVTTVKKPVFEDVGQGTRIDGNAVRYRQSQLNDHKFWLENKADIQLAMVEGRIDPD